MGRPTMLQCAQVAILVLTVIGWVLSYNALQALAEHHGYAGWQSWLVPLTVDLLALSCALLGLVCAQQKSGPTGEAWALAGVAAAVTLGGNTAAAWLAGDRIAIVLHAWPAVCMLGAWHLYFRSIESTPPVKLGLSGARPRRAPTRAPARASVDTAERLRVLLQAAEGAPTTKEIARRLKVSEGHVRKLKARLEGAA